MSERYLKKAIQNDALADKKMAFISGPRQIGKTTLAKAFLHQNTGYFSWDDTDFKLRWVKSPVQAVSEPGSSMIVLDELHKDRRWKGRLKGVYDLLGDKLAILVTGSARLDIFRRGGDSLMGRYLPYQLHGFSVSECENPIMPENIFNRPAVEYPWSSLMRLGVFPEPLLKGNERSAQRWSRLRRERLVREDIRDLKAIQDIHALEVLCLLLPERVGSALSLNAIREEMGIAYGTLYNWMHTLRALYHHFLVRPYAARLSRTLRAEPKMYLFNILEIQSEAARRENLVALHLVKACDFWTDTAQAEFELRYIKTKEKQEIDFCVVRDRKPWMLVECKSQRTQISPALEKFSAMLKPTWSFQLVDSTSVYKKFPHTNIILTSYERFCAGLV